VGGTGLSIPVPVAWASPLGQGHPVCSSDLGSGRGSAGRESQGGHNVPLETGMCVGEGLAMAGEHQAGGSPVSVAEQGTRTVLAACSGLASALKPVQTSKGATGTSRAVNQSG